MTKVEEALEELERNHSSTDCQTAASAGRVLAIVAEARAELARLKPTVQVAEDVALVQRFMATGGTSKDRQTSRSALDRLATKAQGYETADGERRRLALENERLGALRASAESERDTAVADNAARQRVGAMMANACFNLAQRDHLRPDERQTLDELRRAWDALGPTAGAAMLERMMGLEASEDAAQKAYFTMLHSRVARLEEARNEGLEIAAKEADAIAIGAQHVALGSMSAPAAAVDADTIAKAARGIAQTIRAKKKAIPANETPPRL